MRGRRKSTLNKEKEKEKKKNVQEAMGMILQV